MQLLIRLNQMLLKFCEWLLVLFLGVMCVGVAVQMIFRAFGTSILQLEDLIKLSFSWLVFAGIAVLFKNDEHIAVTALVDALPKRAGNAVYLFQRVVTLIFLIWLLVFGVQFALTGLSSLFSQLMIPLFWVYISVPMAAGFGILFYLEFFTANLHRN
jgi:TRAP-type C4-dicarboxylate transport system permease small subunit